jgi:hypothetical protein
MCCEAMAYNARHQADAAEQGVTLRFKPPYAAIEKAVPGNRSLQELLEIQKKNNDFNSLEGWPSGLRHRS